MTRFGSPEHKAAQAELNAYRTRVAEQMRIMNDRTPSHDFDYDDPTEDSPYDDEQPRLGLPPETVAVIAIWAATIVAAFVGGVVCGTVWG